jgi:hypothetical protein
MDLVMVVPLPPERGDRPRFISSRQWTFDGERRLTSIEGNLLSIEIDAETGKRVKHDVTDLEQMVEGLESGGADLEEGAAGVFHGLSPLIHRLKELGRAIMYPTWNCFLTHPDWLSTFVMAFHQRPDLIARYERAQARRAIANARAAIDAGCDVVGIGGDLAYKKGPMISPDMYRKFILPHMRAESKAIHVKGAFSVIASDGNLMPIANDYYIRSGVDAVREIEPGPMDRATVKERFGDRVCLNGNIDCGRTLGLLSVEEVMRETRECIRTWSPGGGHVVSSSNTISPNVKPDNFFAMREAILKYGAYSR